jgi:hypothetical protein
MKLFTLLVLLSAPLFADTVKISELPLVDATAVGSSDSLPFVNSAQTRTMRIKLGDLFLVPALSSQLSLKQGLLPWTTNGDILYWNGSAQRLAKGADGTILTMTSGLPAWVTATGLTSINSQTQTAQTLAVGTSGTDFAVSSSAGTHTFNLPTASASARGALSSSDFQAFSAKLAGSWTSSTGNLVTTNGSSTAQDSGTALSSLAPKASPTFTGTIGTPLTASRVLTTDASGNLAAASTTTTTLGYLDVGSSLTTLLSAKAPTASPTFTGTVTAPTVTVSGLTASVPVVTDGSKNLASQSFATFTGNLSNFVGDSGSGGTKGLVPAPIAGDSAKFLKGDGTWATAGGTSVDTDYTTKTITGAWSTNTTYTGLCRRIGDSLQCRIKVATSGAPTAANLTITLPDSLTINTSKLVSTAFDMVVGRLTINDSSTSAYTGVVAYNSSTSVIAKYYLTSGGNLGFATASSTAPITFGAGDFAVMDFEVPITGWTTGQSL